MDNTVQPEVSIVMGIYNCEGTLGKSIKSIINQTYTNWELIMCDDGSNDQTLTVAEKYVKMDNRVKLIKNDKNRGLAYSLNECIKVSKGKFIARQDADDYSDINRLKIQMDFLKQNDNYGFVTTSALLFDNNGVWGERKTAGHSPDKLELAKSNPFIHPSAIIRKELLTLVCNYTVDKHTYRTEDYDLWFKLYSKGIKGYILPNLLYYFNEDRNSYSRKKFKYRVDESKVRLNGYKNLHLKKGYYILALRPLLVGLLPKSILRNIHRIKSKGYEL